MHPSPYPALASEVSCCASGWQSLARHRAKRRWAFPFETHQEACSVSRGPGVHGAGPDYLLPCCQPRCTSQRGRVWAAHPPCAIGFCAGLSCCQEMKGGRKRRTGGEEEPGPTGMFVMASHGSVSDTTRLFTWLEKCDGA